MHGLPALPRSLTIFPSRLALEHALQPLADTCIATDHATTFTGLISTIGAAIDGQYIGPERARLLVRHTLEQVDNAWAEQAHDAWHVKQVHSALAEVRGAGITARTLQRSPASAELQNFAAILHAYEESLARLHLFDDADQIRQSVLAVAMGTLPSTLRHVRHVTVVAGTEIYGARLDLLNAFAARGVAVQVTLPYDIARAPAFAWTEAMLHGLESRGHQDLQVEYDARQGTGPLTALRAAQCTGQQVPHAAVQVYQVAEGVAHIDMVASQVVQWLRAGTPVHRLAVVHALGSAFDARLTRALQQLGVRAYYRRGLPLSNTLPAQLLLQALRLPEAGFGRDGLADMWAALDQRIDVDGVSLSPEQVVAQLRQAGVRSARVGGVRQPLLASAERRPVGPSRDQAVRRANAVADAVEALMTRLRAVPETATLPAYAQQLLTLLGALRPAFGAPHDAAATQLSDLLTQWMLPNPATAEAVWHKAELIDWLTVLCRETGLDALPSRAGAVAIVRPEDMPATQFDCVIFAGIANGVFPRSAPLDPILTDMLRGEINRCVGPRLVQYAPQTGRATMPGQARDMWLWLETLASCQQSLCVTIPVVAGEDELGQNDVVDALLASTGQVPRWAQSAYARAPVSPAQLLQCWAWQRDTMWEAALAMGANARWRGLQRRVAPEVARQQQMYTLPPLPQANLPQLASYVFDSMHSTSRLDSLGVCRYRHFAAHILHASPEEIPTLGASPREQGSVAHAALHRVYLDIMAGGGLTAARRDPAQAVARAQHVFWQHAEAILAETIIHPLLRQSTLQQAWQTVRVQLERDLTASAPRELLALEHRFDDRPDARTSELCIADPTGQRGIRVRGSIDRVEIEAGTLMVLDYKRSPAAREPERHFQLPIYVAAALRDLLPNASAVSAGWIGLADGKRRLAEDVCGTPVALSASLQRTVWQRLDELLTGTIAPDPENAAACERCDFRALCRQADAIPAELTQEAAV